MGGSSTSDTQSTQSTQLPAWVQQAGQSNYGVAQGIAGTAYDPNRNVSVAGTTDATNQGYGLIQSTLGQAAAPVTAAEGIYNANSGYVAPTVGTGTVGTGTLATTDLSPYLNPYTKDVTDAALATGQQALGQSISGNNAAATAAKAFGGTRAAVTNGVTNSQYALGEASQAAALNQANFTQAQDAAKTDIANTLTASGQNAANTLTASNANASNSLASAGVRDNSAAGLLSSSGALTTANNNDINNLLTQGTAQQTQNQNVLTANTTNANQQYQDKVDKLNLLLSSLGMTPYNTTTTGTSDTTKSASPDLATLGLGIGKLFGLSEDTMKVDKTFLGKIPGTPLKIHAFRYKGDPKHYPKSVGVMASEVQKHTPEAITKVGTKRAVNYGMLAKKFGINLSAA